MKDEATVDLHLVSLWNISGWLPIWKTWEFHIGLGKVGEIVVCL